MEQITRNLLQQLLEPSPGAHITIYMPTYKHSPDSLQNPIRFNNLTKQAKQELLESNQVNHQIKESLAKAAEMVDDADYWMHQKSGLAIFISQSYRLFLRLPLKFPETVIVNQHFYLKPLLPLLTTNGKYYILTLSAGDIKLYQATRDNIDKLYLGDTPKSLSAYLHQSGYDSQTPAKSGTKPTDRITDVSAIPEALLTQFLSQIQKHLQELLSTNTAPLVLAGVKELTTAFRGICHYPHITLASIEGSPDHLSKQDIHQQAWKIVRPLFKQAEKEALGEYHQLKSTGKTANSLEAILPAAFAGRIKTLFVLRDHSIWGMFDPDSSTLALTKTNQPGTDDLMNLATIYTLLGDGRVYSLKPKEMVKGTPIAATYRY